MNDGRKRRPEKNGSASRWMKVLPLCVTGVMILVCLFFVKDLSFRDIVSFTPKNLFLAALVLWFLYAVKSISVVFPLTVLFMAAGVMFPLWAALLVGIGGLAVSLTIPYYIGRFSGKDFVDGLVERYPKARKLYDMGQRNHVFLSFLTRIIAIVPGDVVSALLGAMEIPYGKFLLGSQLGLFPGLVIQTLLGTFLDQKFEWWMAVLFAALLAVSWLLSFFCNKRSRKQP